MILAYPAKFSVHYDVRDKDDTKIIKGGYRTTERKILHLDLEEVMKLIGEREFPGKTVVIHGVHAHDGSPLTPHGLKSDEVCNSN